MLKKIFKIFSVLVCVGALVASDAMPRQQFTAADGAQLFIRQATVADFYNGNIGFNATDAEKAKGVESIDGKIVLGSKDTFDNRKQRVADNIVGVCLIERALDGGLFEIVDRIFAGRMPLGVQPAKMNEDGNIEFFREDGSPDTITAARLAPIVRMYLELGKACSVEPVFHGNGTKVVLSGMHALTVVLGGQYGTISAQEAICKLVAVANTKVASDPGVSDVAVPVCCVSITKEAVADSSASFVIPALGYYADKRNADTCALESGLHNAVITPIIPFGVAVFKKSLSAGLNGLSKYVDGNKFLLAKYRQDLAAGV